MLLDLENRYSKPTPNLREIRILSSRRLIADPPYWFISVKIVFPVENGEPTVFSRTKVAVFRTRDIVVIRTFLITIVALLFYNKGKYNNRLK